MVKTSLGMGFTSISFGEQGDLQSCSSHHELTWDANSQAEVAAGLICNSVLIFPSYFKNPFRSRLSYRDDCRHPNSSRKSGRFSNTPEMIMRHPEAIRWSGISRSDDQGSTDHQTSHFHDSKIGLQSWLKLSDAEVGADQSP